jgi:diguanylate cyclase (GGDEF)-like protein
MAKLITYGKEYLLFAAEIVFLVALFGIFLLIDFSIYLKLAVAFIFVLFLVGWFLLSFSRLQQRYRLLVEKEKQDAKRFRRLSELAGELPRIPLVRDRYPEIASRLGEIFKEHFNSDKFLLFARNKNVYRCILAHNIAGSQRGKIAINSNSEFVSQVTSAGGPMDMEFLLSAKVPVVLRALVKEHHFNRLVPLTTESDLWGFVIFSATTPHSARAGGSMQVEETEAGPDEKLVLLVLNQVALGLEREDLAAKLKETEKKVAAGAKQEGAELSILRSDLKRKIFDLNAVLELAGNLYSILEEEGLFSLLARMMQDHLGARSVFLMFPHAEEGNIVGKYFYGAHTSDLFGKETISELKIEQGKALFNWIKNERQIWPLYGMQKLAREDAFLKALLASGFQIGAKLTFSENDFGVIFLGEKTDGAKYRRIDLDILAILVNMAVITYENIRRFKSIEELSHTDHITALYNYRYFYKRLTEEVFRAKRFLRKLALVIFDIDDFKVYNDTFGHQAGDQLLHQLGELLTRTVRSIDVVCRYGGEEFCVIMPESDQEECLKFMERLRKNIMNFAFKDERSKQEHNITVSLGGAIYPYEARSVDRLIYCADMALLKAKSAGKNRSVMFQEQLEPVAQLISADAEEYLSSYPETADSAPPE